MQFALEPHTANSTRYELTAPDLPDSYSAAGSFFDEVSANVLTAPAGYAIRRDGNHSPAYWMAYRPGSHGKPCIDRDHELGAGAGDEGWKKCVRLCEQHQSEQGVTARARGK